MRLDHLLSKESSKGWNYCLIMNVLEKRDKGTSGGDAIRGNTRTHPEHDG